MDGIVEKIKSTDRRPQHTTPNPVFRLESRLSIEPEYFFYVF